MDLEGGSRLGNFWDHCKSERRCSKPPYDRLLTNPVLRADYHSPRSVTKSSRPLMLRMPRGMWIIYGPSCSL